MRWSIFYTSGATFTSEDGDPVDAPRQGVAVIVQHDDDGNRNTLHRHDCYCWERGMWVEHDRFGCERYLDTEPHPVRLVGYCQPVLEYMATVKRASKALRF